MEILVTLKAGAEEKALIEEILGPVHYMTDGIPGHVDGVLSLWPRREFQKAGIRWNQLPGVQWLKVITAGANHIGWKDIPEHLKVMTTPGATGDTIGEYVLGATIAWARGFQRSTREIKAGRFNVGEPTRSVSELRVGVVGHGGIGQSVATELLSRGAEVRAVSRSGEARMDIRVDPMNQLPELAAWADILVLCLPLTKETLHLVDAQLLARFSGLLINVARGPVVDEDALDAWLEIPGNWAHLDVWWQYSETFPATRVHKHSNVTMTPHNSPNTSGFRIRMLERACQDLLELQAGNLLHIEDPADYEMPIDGDGR